MSRRKLKGLLKDWFYSIVLRKKINNYFKQIAERHPSKVIYTCMTNDYDCLKVNTFLNPDYKYVCFTDNEKYLKRKKVGPWQVCPLPYAKADNTRNSRYPKIHPHELFPEFSESVYIDANILLKTNKLFAAVEEMSGTDVVIAIPPHRHRGCIYIELEKCIKIGNDKKEVLEKHRAFLESEGFPHNKGLTENNVIYRKHLDPKCVKLMNDWWYMLDNYSRRDQLSLFYVLWKNSLEMTYLLDVPIKSDKANFRLSHHNK